MRGGRYLDLATGDHVLLRLTTLDAIRMREWVERCVTEESRTPNAIDGSVCRLIDYGSLGLGRCFEARATQVQSSAVRIEALEDSVRLADRVLSAANSNRSAGVKVVRMPRLDETKIDTRELCSHLARRLRPHGYVTVRACTDLSAQIVAALCHRHVVITCFTPVECARAASWVRRFGDASPRAHLVVDASGSSVRRQVAHVHMRERPPESTVRHHTSRYLVRAATFTSRRRLAAAARCLRAAAASALRERDGPLQLEAAGQLVALLMRRGEVDDAIRAGWRVLREMPRYPHRFGAIQVAADTLISCGELADADRLLSTVAAECALTRLGVQGGVQMCQVKLCFWKGRFDRAQILLDSVVPRNIETEIWRGLIGWARGDPAVSQTAVRVLNDFGSESSDVWSQAIDLMCGTSDRDGPATSALVNTLAVNQHADDLLRVALLEALMQRDLTAAADDLAAARPQGRVIAPLYQQLSEWIRSDPKAARHPSGAQMRDVGRRGTLGFLRWGLRKKGVHVIESVPRLLQIVSDAEDDVAALTHACAWVEQHPGVSAVTILATGEGRVVAGAGIEALEMDSVDLQDAIRSPRRVRNRPVRWRRSHRARSHRRTDDRLGDRARSA